MNQCLYRGFAVAVLVSTVSFPVTVAAEQVDLLETLLQADEDLEVSSEPLENEGLEASEQVDQPKTLLQVDEDLEASPQLLENNDLEASFESLEAGSESLEHEDSDAANQADRAPSLFQGKEQGGSYPEIVQVISHALDEKEAATLYVKDIPVLTFVGQEMSVLASKSRGVEAERSTGDMIAPVNRATEIAQQLEQFYQAAGDPEMILVRWDAEIDEYVIDVASEILISINEETLLPDTTDDLAEDALQATNRLRRLLGGASPLTEIAGRPQPEPAVRHTWNVSSVSTGRASWYGPGFHGRRTANGEVFNQNAMTAAHRTLPFGTVVRVTNLRNNRQVVVRINDRGPFTGGRILDLSAGAARAIGLQRSGVGPIRLEVLSR